MNTVSEAPDPRTDVELLHAYREGDEDGRALPEIYRRHRDKVLQVLEDEGLPPREADDRIGAVFLRALSRDSSSEPLRETLCDEARAVAHDPDWLPF